MRGDWFSGSEFKLTASGFGGGGFLGLGKFRFWDAGR